MPPSELSWGVNRRNYIHTVGGGGPLVFLSILCINACHILEPVMNAALGKPQRSVEGGVLEGEYERMVGCIGMIIQEKEFRLPLFKDNLSFTTAFGTGDSGRQFQHIYLFGGTNNHCPLGGPSSPYPKHISSGQPSPFTGTAPGNFKSYNSKNDKVSLSFQDIGTYILCAIYISRLLKFYGYLVPIYDARKVRTTDFTVVLDHLDELPRYSMDVPHGACAVVAYTANTFSKKNEDLKSISLNIRWLMVMGVIGDKAPKKKRG
jgi:hypothetical protein